MIREKQLYALESHLSGFNFVLRDLIGQQDNEPLRSPKGKTKQKGINLPITYNIKTCGCRNNYKK